MQVTQLWRYPIKSLAGQRLTSATVDELGIAGDRQWALLDHDTRLVLTARRVPALLFADPVIDGDEARIRLPDGTVSADREVLSDWLGRPVSLLRATPDTRGRYEIALDEADPDSEWEQWHGPKGVFHDSTQTRLSIISEGSLGAWDIRRFRPNIVVSDAGERNLVKQDITVGQVRLRVMKHIDRCVIVTRPQPDLERDLQVLKDVNRHHHGELGVGALVRDPGVVSIGDQLGVFPGPDPVEDEA